MSTRLSEVTVSKPAALAVVLSLAVMPWFQGGQDPVGWMVLWGVALLGGFILWRSDVYVRVGRLGLVWLAFLAWTALSLVWSINRYQTITTLLLYLLLGVVFVLAASLRENATARAAFDRTYLLVASVASVLGIIFFVTNNYDRATSTFYLPNPFAAFLLPIVIIGLWRFAERQRLLEGIVAMLNLGVLILTDSRGAILALVAAVFIGLWLSQSLVKHWRRLLIVAVGALAIALLANVVRSHNGHKFEIEGARFKNIASTDSSSTTDRIYYLKSALGIWSDRPILGSGAGTFSTLHPRYQYRVISAGNNVHNFYVQTLADLGMVGFLLLILVLFELLKGVVRGIKADPTRLPFALGLLALLLHFGLDIDSNYPVLWSLVVILAALCYVPKTKDDKVHKVSISMPAMAFAMAIVLSLPTVWLFQNQVKAENARDLQSSGEYDRASARFGLAVLHPPYDADWLTGEGINDYTLASIGSDKATNAANLNKALALGRQARRLDSQDGQHDFLIARVERQQKAYGPAEADYKQAITKDPYDHPDYYNDLASLYLQQGKLKAADDTLGVVMSLYTDSVIGNRNADTSIAPAIANSYVIAAQVALGLSDTSRARDLLNKAIKLDSTNLAARFLLLRIGQ